jgi:secreted Zn-dependent insulinase-like peptidase
MRQTHRTLGYCFQVTSSSHSVEVVHNALMDFIESIVPHLITTLPLEEFEDHVKSVINKKLTPFPSLGDAAGASWSRIDDGSLDFLEHDAVATYLNEFLTPSKLHELQLALVRYAERLFLSEERRLLVIHSAADHTSEAVSASSGPTNSDSYIMMNSAHELRQFCGSMK